MLSHLIFAYTLSINHIIYIYIYNEKKYFRCIYIWFMELSDIYLFILYYIRVFHISVFHWSLSDKSPQVSRTRLRILAVLSNAVIWIDLTRPPTSKSSWPFNNSLVIEPKTQITTGTIVIFMFHSFFNSLARSRYLSFFSVSFRFILWSVKILQILFFCGWLL